MVRAREAQARKAHKTRSVLATVKVTLVDKILELSFFACREDASLVKISSKSKIVSEMSTISQAEVESCISDTIFMCIACFHETISLKIL